MATRHDSTGWDSIAALIPPERLLYRIGPPAAPPCGDLRRAVRHSLLRPIGSPPFGEMVRAGDEVVILADDLTRTTPQEQLLPPLVECLNEAGVPDGRITVLIALGTHRYMTPAEIRSRFGEELCGRVRVVNHLWKDPATFLDVGPGTHGAPVGVNRIACEADLLIGTGSIVPHVWAGWSGGAKIVLPGVCSAGAIAPAHALAARDAGLLEVAGRAGDSFRREAQRVARRVGLRFILNVVAHPAGRCVWVGAGDPVRAHRAGIAAAERQFVREIPAEADIALVDARPATLDYWQGIKALAHGARGVRDGGTLILVGEFRDGVTPTHPEFARHALKSEVAILKDWRAGRIGDEVIVTTLRLHALIRQRCRVVCLSGGLSPADCRALGFRHADGPEQALAAALEQQGTSAKIGVIEHAGDVLPRIAEA